MAKKNVRAAPAVAQPDSDSNLKLKLRLWPMLTLPRAEARGHTWRNRPIGLHDVRSESRGVLNFCMFSLR